MTSEPAWTPNRPGEQPHAVPASGRLHSYDTCKACHGIIYRDGYDEQGRVVYTHLETDDHFCQAP
jgi:hypothetical protein